MPYITKERENQLLTDDLPDMPECEGELNFLITSILVLYLERKGLSYQNIADACSAAYQAAKELERRVLAPYEIKKHTNPKHADPYIELEKMLNEIK